MKAKSKQKQHIDLSIGDFDLRIDSRGDLLTNAEKGEQFERIFTAKQLDQIAARCKQLHGLRGRLESLIGKEIGEYTGPEQDERYGYDVVFESEPDIDNMLDGIGIDGVSIGCQHVEASDVARVHKVSLAMRARNKKR